ncbi:MAG: DegV family protein [Actinomycetes bacterium]|jgi:DegV family protein with EDD domain|nr:DegV family protein [Actinomycetes bacterium]
MGFHLVSDSSSNLPKEVIDEFGITIIPTPYYREGEDAEFRSDLVNQTVDMKEFFEGMERGEVFKTSLITYAVCEEYLGPLLRDTDEDILYIVFSSGLTGTYEVVRGYFREQADRYPGRKLIAIDSLAASLGMGLIVYKAACLQRDGADIDEVATWVREHVLESCHWFTVSDLKYLRRGGRISGASAAVGTMLDIKPVMHVNNEGKLEPVEKVRGRRKSINALVDHMAATAFEPVADQDVFIVHGNCPDDAEYLRAQVEERMGVTKFLINYLDPVIGAHSGPGTLALFFMGHPR